MTRPGVAIPGSARRTVVGAALLVASAVVFVLSPLHGPVLLSLSGSHGVDVGDLVALPFLAVGAFLLAGGPSHRHLLRLAERAGGDLATAAGWMLIATGAAFVLVLLVDESSLPEQVPHAGGPSLVLSLVSLAALAVLLLDRETCEEVLGAPLWISGVALLAGFAVDLTHPEAGPVVGPTVLAALFFVTLGRRMRAARWAMGVLLVLFVLWDLLAWVDPRTFEPERKPPAAASRACRCARSAHVRARHPHAGAPPSHHTRSWPRALSERPGPTLSESAFRRRAHGSRSESPSSLRAMISATGTRGESGASR